MIIEQKKFSNKTRFTFNDEKLSYWMKDSTASHGFDVSYLDISQERHTYEERNVWFRNAGLIWIMISVLTFAWSIFDTGKPIVSFWLYIGVICLAIYRFSKTEFTVIPTEKGKIFVIKDASHDRLLDEFEKHRVASLRKRYGKVDFDNEPQNELAKFNWLLNNGVIDESEYQSAVKQIEAYMHSTSLVNQTSGITIN